MARVALCEDDASIRRVVSNAMKLAGHTVVVAEDGGEALSLFADDDLDAIVLDIVLPDADGRDVCQALRTAGQPAPVLFLTALGNVQDRLAGFYAGGDDYLAKPFDIQELIARVEALAKRSRAVTGVALGDLALDPARHALVCNGKEAILTPTEFRMLAAITSRPGEVVRRSTVISATWPDGGPISGNTVDSYIRRIRARLRDVETPLKLRTVRGVGYTLR